MSEHPSSSVVIARALFDGRCHQPQPNMAIYVAQGRIKEVRPAQDTDKPAVIADIICPGFVDMQINGANDVQFNDTPTADGVAAIMAGARQGGTTHILPTFITAPDTSYQLAIQAVTQARAAGTPGILGVHLEGPFLSPQRPGIHPPHCIRPLEPQDLETLCAANCGVRLVTLAPECAPAGAIQALSQSGALVFAGHSAATQADIETASQDGLRGATHLFNAMSQLTVREPGVVGAVLGSDQLFAGVIADGIHVHPTNLKLAAQVLGDRFCLVTDAMLTLAGTRQSFDLFGVTIHRQENRLSDATGCLAGAHLAMDEAVSNMVRLCGTPLAEALYMASVNPIRALGLGADMGCIQPGYCASMTLLDDSLQAVGTIVDGQIFETSKAGRHRWAS